MFFSYGNEQVYYSKTNSKDYTKIESDCQLRICVDVGKKGRTIYCIFDFPSILF